MSGILSIDQLREMAYTVIDIPSFDGQSTIKVKVQKPRIMVLISQGKIPNPLMSVASKMVKNKGKESDFDIEQGSKIFELYCFACLVEPVYEEMKDIITDDQILAIFDWAIEGASALEPFRTIEADGTGDNSSEKIPEETK